MKNLSNYRKLGMALLGVIAAIGEANIPGTPSWVYAASAGAAAALVWRVPNRDKKAG